MVKKLVRITWSVTLDPKDWDVDVDDPEEVQALAAEIFTGEADPPDGDPDIGIVYLDAEEPPAEGFAIIEG